MDVEAAIHAFASAGHDLPRGAMRWVLDNWDEAAPGLLGVLERFVDGTDRSEEAANALFFILHLAGERRETRAFAPLCRLAKDAEAIEAVLGDGVTTTLKGILLSTYDGDLDAPAPWRSWPTWRRPVGSLGTRRRPTCSGSTTRCGHSTRASSGTAGPWRSRFSGSRRCPVSSGRRSHAA
jgi:hypothetical protein